MSTWNYRVLAHEFKGELFFQIHEVYYDKNGNPDGYSENASPVGSESVKEINTVLKQMKCAVKKPVLWAGKKFPSICTANI